MRERIKRRRTRGKERKKRRRIWRVNERRIKGEGKRTRRREVIMREGKGK